MEENLENEVPKMTKEEFDEVISKIESYNLEKDDIVIFRNDKFGRVQSLWKDEINHICRIYVDFNGRTINLDENFNETSGERLFDVKKIAGSDFTLKFERQLNDLVLTKEEAEKELSKIKGAPIRIDGTTAEDSSN